MTHIPTDRLRPLDLDKCHCVDVQARFSDYDMFRHVNNNSLLAYLDIGKTAFFNHVMHKECTPVEIGAVIVNINVDFMSPALAGQPLKVWTGVSRVSPRSVTLEQRLTGLDPSDVKVQATTVLAGFDPVSQVPAPVNPVFAARLKDFS